MKLKSKRLLIVIPDSPIFRSLAGYADKVLSPEFHSLNVLMHETENAGRDFSSRSKRVGVICALDEYLYSICESFLTPWSAAVANLGLNEYAGHIDSVTSLRSEHFFSYVTKGRFDYLIGLGCEYIPISKLPSKIIPLNIHPGILPRYRGAGNPEALLNGNYSYMGVTIHKMTDRLDDGIILARKHISLLKRLSIPSSYLASYKIGLKLLPGAIENVDSPVSPSKAPEKLKNLWRMRLSLFILFRFKQFLGF